MVAKDVQTGDRVACVDQPNPQKQLPQGPVARIIRTPEQRRPIRRHSSPVHAKPHMIKQWRPIAVITSQTRITSMSVSVRQQLIARSDANPQRSPPQAGIGSHARPLELLGAPPRRDVTYLSDAARALSGPQAARVATFPGPGEVFSGNRIDTRA